MNKQLFITAIVMLALGTGGGYWLANRQHSREQPAGSLNRKQKRTTFVLSQSDESIG